MKQGTLLAAIDLGSNSFRLEIGRYDYKQIQRIDYLKEVVRLGNGLDAHRNLTPEAINRGLACLSRFSERLSGFKKNQIRVVATQTLREAKNRDDFLRLGQEILGCPIEVISGTEEARLIYSGVTHLLPQDNQRRLVVDIGGRSTELVIGQGQTATQTASYRLGSVSWSLKYFPNGVLSEAAFYKAGIAAQAILEDALVFYPRRDWDLALGASGTVGAVADILELAGWQKGEISAEGLNWLMRSMTRAGHSDQLYLQGLKQDRRPVIGGGVSILNALMQLLKIETMNVAVGALRHGVLFEMVEREDQTTDTRDLATQRMALKFSVDGAQSHRVGELAVKLFSQLNYQQLSDPIAQPLARQLIWASALHEVGFAVAHSDYHKHGSYILDNADLLGFSMPELHRLSMLVLGHRGKLKKLEHELVGDELALLLMALRLSVVLCHARRTPDAQALKLSCDYKRKRIELHVEEQWVAKYPQSTHLLKQEEVAWQKMPWTFCLQVTT